MIVVDKNWLSLEQVVSIARGEDELSLDQSDDYVSFIDQGASLVMGMLEREGEVYGVTTGYGDSCSTGIPSELVAELPNKLFVFHGCGTGEYLTDEQVRAVLMVRLISLSKGASGVRFELLQAISRLIQHDILPRIPSEGSVGASGDLTPLSYVAAVLSGQRQVRKGGVAMSAEDALRLQNLKPIQLQPKETLAIMNGTAVMTAIATLALDRASYLSRLASRITALVCMGVGGNKHHFDRALFSVKPHGGQQIAAARIEADLSRAPEQEIRLQDRYSIRCAPHIIGVLEDSLTWSRDWVERELNSANDNPIIDVENNQIHHGGHFYGGHIAFAMDSLKTAVANLADLFDRQMALLVDIKFNVGMPANLSGASAERLPINHGFKALQIAVSSWTAEALKLTMPASAFSRSTECHNQDKVSMGTIASRDCVRILQLTEQAAAVTIMASLQAVEIRANTNLLDLSCLSTEATDFMVLVREYSAFLTEDRAMDAEILKMVQLIQDQSLPISYPGLTYDSLSYSRAKEARS